MWHTALPGSAITSNFLLVLKSALNVTALEPVSGPASQVWPAVTPHVPQDAAPFKFKFEIPDVLLLLVPVLALVYGTSSSSGALSLVSTSMFPNFLSIMAESRYYLTQGLYSMKGRKRASPDVPAVLL